MSDQKGLNCVIATNGATEEGFSFSCALEEPGESEMFASLPQWHTQRCTEAEKTNKQFFKGEE